MSWVAPWVGSRLVSPSTSPHSTRWVCPLRRSALAGSWTATRLITQSRLRACSSPTSYTVPVTPEVVMVTVLSNSSPTTSVSVERCSNRRMLSRPVV